MWPVLLAMLLQLPPTPQAVVLTPGTSLGWEDSVEPAVGYIKATGYAVCIDVTSLPLCVDVGLPNQTTLPGGTDLSFRVPMSTMPAIAVVIGVHTVTVFAYAVEVETGKMVYSPPSVPLTFTIAIPGAPGSPAAPTGVVVIADPTCTPPLGANAPSIAITSVDKTTGKPGSNSRLNYQLASIRSPIVSIIARIDGVDTGYRIAGADLTRDGGIWFVTPSSGTHQVGLHVANAYGCELTRTSPVAFVVP